MKKLSNFINEVTKLWQRTVSRLTCETEHNLYMYELFLFKHFFFDLRHHNFTKSSKIAEQKNYFT